MKRYQIIVWFVAFLFIEPLCASHRGGSRSSGGGVAHTAPAHAGGSRINTSGGGVYSTRARGYNTGGGLYPLPVAPIQPVVVANPPVAYDSGYSYAPAPAVVVVDQAPAQPAPTISVSPYNSNSVVVNPAPVNVSVTGGSSYATAQPVVISSMVATSDDQTVSAADVERRYLEDLAHQFGAAGWNIATTLGSATRIKIAPAVLQQLPSQTLNEVYELVKLIASGKYFAGTAGTLEKSPTIPQLFQLIVVPQTRNNCGLVSMRGMSNYIRKCLGQKSFMTALPTDQWHDADALEKLWNSSYGKLSNGAQVPALYVDAGLVPLGDDAFVASYANAQQQVAAPDFIANRIAQMLVSGISACVVFINTGSAQVLAEQHGENSYHWFAFGVINAKDARQYVVIDSFGGGDINVNGRWLLSGTEQSGFFLNANRLEDTAVNTLATLIEQQVMSMKRRAGR